MSKSVDPLAPVGSDRRRKARRVHDRAADAAPTSCLPVVVTGGGTAPERPEAQGSAVFAAQLLGQPGEKRGLRGGPETLEKARAAYLEAEWSGPLDRRNSSGQTTNADI